MFFARFDRRTDECFADVAVPQRVPLFVHVELFVNVKLGVRLGILDRTDVYAGWGRPLTGDRWYENIFRMELRFLF